MRTSVARAALAGSELVLAIHLAPIAEPHWHIDYLLGFSTPIEVWYALSDRKLE
jgi:Uri superfamily endonuclease